MVHINGLLPEYINPMNRVTVAQQSECRPELPDDADDGGDDAPTTLPSGQTPIPQHTGMKYPVRESLTSTWSRTGEPCRHSEAR